MAVEALQQHRRNILMPAGQANGKVVINNLKGYQYVNFINNTSGLLDMYQGVESDVPNLSNKFLSCPSYGQYSFPLDQRPDYTFFWEHGGTVDESVTIIFTKENLNFNSTYVVPASTLNSVIIQDDVGLAKAVQLPGVLSPGGFLKTEVMAALPAGTNHIGAANIDNLPTDYTKQNQLPGALTPGFNLKTAVLEPLPTGNNNIGNVDVLTMPSLPAGTNTVGAVQAAAQSFQLITTGSGVIKSTPGVLGTVNIAVVAAAAATLTLFNNTAASGAIIAVFDLTKTGSYVFNLDASAGIAYTVSTGTTNVTVTYR